MTDDFGFASLVERKGEVLWLAKSERYLTLAMSVLRLSHSEIRCVGPDQIYLILSGWGSSSVESLEGKNHQHRAP